MSISNNTLICFNVFDIRTNLDTKTSLTKSEVVKDKNLVLWYSTTYLRHLFPH